MTVCACHGNRKLKTANRDVRNSYQCRFANAALAPVCRASTQSGTQDTDRVILLSQADRAGFATR